MDHTFKLIFECHLITGSSLLITSVVCFWFFFFQQHLTDFVFHLKAEFCMKKTQFFLYLASGATSCEHKTLRQRTSIATEGIKGEGGDACTDLTLLRDT